MVNKEYFKNARSEAEEMYSNASGRRSAFRGQTGGTDEPIGGCTDFYANNFNPNADYDNGTCTYGGAFGGGGGFPCDFPTPNQGCTDSRAVNYDPSACFDNGSCSFGGVYGEIYSNEYTSNYDQCVNVCTTSSGGSTTGGGIVDSAFGTGKDPKGKGKRKRKGMRSATGGGKTKVATAVNWLIPII